MRRSRLHAGNRVHYEVAAVVAVLGLTLVGRPLLAGGQAADAAFTIPATAGLLTSTAPPAPAAAPTAAAPAAEPAAPPAPTDPLAWFAPGGRNEGTENLAGALAAIALQDNEPLYISDGWGRTWGASSSDHSISRTDSWAIDVAVRGIQQPTPQTEEAARRVAAALGQPDWTGGDLKVTIQGYRFQILWKVAGHFNHVHIGVRKV